VEITKLYIVRMRLEENSLISEDRLILNAPSKIRINRVKVVNTGATEARSSGDVYPNPLGPIRNPSIIRNNTSVYWSGEIMPRIKSQKSLLN